MDIKRSFLMTLVMMIMVWELECEPLAVGATNYTWVGSKYQIECTMCASCDNPCDTPSPPPPPPPPTPPPQSPTTNNCPPPPPPPHSSNYYYSPPPPPSSGSNYPYTPPRGVVGNYYPPPYKAYPSGLAPPPPNPIVPYFPFYFHSPSPPSHSVQLRASLSHLIIMPFLSLYFI